MKQIHFFALLMVLFPSAARVHGQSELSASPSAAPIERRVPDIFTASDNPRAGICYGPFRDGQAPGGAQPTRAEIREDLNMMAQHWRMLRLYGSDPFAEVVCSVIREEGLDLKVLVGAWIVTESTLDQEGERVDIPSALEGNRIQVNGAIQLANKYPDIIAAVSVGNEALVSWSFHAIQPERLVGYVRQVRRESKSPVTVADDLMYWVTPKSRALAAELDFIVMHAYAMWHGQPLDNAVSFVESKYAEVKQVHPDHLVVIGETGWATDKAKSGEEAERLKGEAGEAQQSRYYQELTEWAAKQKIPLFYFEAFDETWKGGSDPHEAEKHWGLYRADRTPKEAIRRLNDAGRSNLPRMKVP